MPIKTIRNLLIAVILSMAGTAFAEDCRPSLAGDHPNLVPPAGGAIITGHPVADERLRRIARERGYRPQARLADEKELAFPWSVHRCVVPHWIGLHKAALEAGHNITIVSGYRSVVRQRQIFLSKLFEFGIDTQAIAAGKHDEEIASILDFSALPGYSRHHSGFAIDIQQDTDGLSAFGDSPAYRWLAADNFSVARRFGFLPSYPRELPGQGPVPEPWEFIWVGDATDLVDDDFEPAAGDELLHSARRIVLAIDGREANTATVQRNTRTRTDATIDELPGG